MNRDSILIESDFTPATGAALECLFGSELVRGGVESWAWIWFCLRSLPDDSEYFPCGKWGTIQHIEQMLDEVVASGTWRAE